MNESSNLNGNGNGWRTVPTPTSRCRAGIGRVDITPPVGIYHRFWGAAKHDTATGVHRPLSATVLLLAPGDASEADRRVIVAIDHCLLRPPEMNELLTKSASLTGLDAEQITFCFSHSHAAGHIARTRAHLPGGELIGPYLDALPEKVATAYRSADESQEPVVLTYGRATSRMGAHRDLFDDGSGQFVCGFNPQENLHPPVDVVRVTGAGGELVATVVAYACHPTTLAWDNTLLSPDYVGALRETVERVTGSPCVFLLSPCGDVGPRVGFVGDVEQADRNGRQVAYAALEALESLPKTGHDFHYAGPVVSGATIGTWEYRPHPAKREGESRRFRRRRWTIPLAYRADLPGVDEAEREFETLAARESAARHAGDEQGARDFRALVERQQRLLERIRPLPPGDEYPYAVEVLQLGDAFWVFVEGEPYHALQRQLSRRLAGTAIVTVTLSNGSRPSYLPTRTAYEKPLYQVDVALLAAGCLERIIDEVAEQIATWRGDSTE